MTAFVFGLVLFSFVTGGKCNDVQCAKIPIGNLDPCKAFVLGTMSKPSDECCTDYGSGGGCLRMLQSPKRLSYKPDQLRTTTLPFVCQAPEFYKYVACLV